MRGVQHRITSNNLTRFYPENADNGSMVHIVAPVPMLVVGTCETPKVNLES